MHCLHSEYGEEAREKLMQVVLYNGRKTVVIVSCQNNAILVLLSLTLTSQLSHSYYRSGRQWLKYKFGGPGTLKKIGALLYTEGAPLNVLVPLRAVWGLGTLASNYKGPKNGIPRVPPYFNHCWSGPKAEFTVQMSSVASRGNVQCM